MALTIEVSPDKFSALFRNIPINVEVSSTQFGDESYTATSVADNGIGKCRYTIGTHLVLNNGVVTGTGFATPKYNVRQNVITTAATFIDTDIDFISNDTGTITRTNDNFQIRAEIRTEPGPVKIGDKIATVIDVGGNDRFRFNPANMLTSVISHDLEPVGGTNLITPNDNSILIYSIKYFEEFNDADGLLQQRGNITESIKFGLNATRQYLDADQTLDEYVIDTVAEHKFLTNAPLTQKIALTEEAQLSFLFDVAGAARIRAERYDGSGSLHDTITLANVTPDTFRMIAPINDTLFDVATLPDISKIIVWIIDASANQMTEKRTFVIDRQCPAHPVRFQFLNLLGGFDPYTFTGHRKETVRTQQIPFSKSLGLSFSIGDRGLSTLAVKSKFIREVRSDFLNEEDRIWLTELFTSTEIFIQEGTDLIPVVRSTVQMKFIDDGGLTQLRIRYEMPKRIIQTN